MHTNKIKRVIKQFFKLAFIWGVSGIFAFTLIALLYTQFIGRDKVELNATIYENHRLVGQDGELGLASIEGRGYTSHGENALVVNKTLAPDSRKVVFLGDSFVYARQVSDEYKFTEVFENKWNTLYPSNPVQAVNLGLDGEDMRTYVSFNQNIDEQYQPDLVVILLGHDDFYQLASDPVLLEELAENGVTTPLTEPVNPTFLENIINQTNFRYFFYVLKNQTLGFIAKGSLSSPEPENSEFETDELTAEEINLQLQILQNYWGDRLVILYHNWYWMPDMDRDLPPTYDDIALQEMDKLGIAYVNLYDPFRQAFLDHTPPFGFNNSTLGKGHFNKLGHESVADELIHLLANEQLVRNES